MVSVWEGGGEGCKRCSVVVELVAVVVAGVKLLDMQPV
jgi:hypothetical protein